MAHLHEFPSKKFGFIRLVAEFGFVSMANGGVLIELLLKCFGMRLKIFQDSVVDFRVDGLDFEDKRSQFDAFNALMGCPEEY